MYCEEVIAISALETNETKLIEYYLCEDLRAYKIIGKSS
jgi:hypothetical protein